MKVMLNNKISTNDYVLVTKGCDETFNKKYKNKQVKVLDIITKNDVGATEDSPFYKCVHPTLGVEHFWREELELING